MNTMQFIYLTIHGLYNSFGQNPREQRLNGKTTKYHSKPLTGKIRGYEIISYEIIYSMHDTNDDIITSVS